MASTPKNIFLPAEFEVHSLSSSAPLLPYSITRGNHFIVFWWKISGSQWKFDIKEDRIIVHITLPAPTTKQLESYCGDGAIQTFPQVIHDWEFLVPENILLVPNKSLCRTFSDESFLGIRVPVRTINEEISLSIE